MDESSWGFRIFKPVEFSVKNNYEIFIEIQNDKIHDNGCCLGVISGGTNNKISKVFKIHEHDYKLRLLSRKYSASFAILKFLHNQCKILFKKFRFPDFIWLLEIIEDICPKQTEKVVSIFYFWISKGYLPLENRRSNRWSLSNFWTYANVVENCHIQSVLKCLL